MKEFREHITAIDTSTIRDDKSLSDTAQSGVSLSSVDELFQIAAEAVNILNKSVGQDIIRIYRIEQEIVPLLFNFGEGSTGFAIISPKKYVFIVSNRGSVIYAYGLEKNKHSAGVNLMSNSKQLISVYCKKSENAIEFTDNTGSYLDPQEVIYQLFRWLAG